MHYVSPVRMVASVDHKSLRLVALLALWLRSEKAASAG